MIEKTIKHILEHYSDGMVIYAPKKKKEPHSGQKVGKWLIVFYGEYYHGNTLLQALRSIKISE